MITKQGTITSAAMKNTITVVVHQLVHHPLYKKSYRKSKKFLADTAGTEDLRVGDEVRIQECRPLSKRKHFKLVEVVKRVPRVSEMAEEKGLAEAMHRTKTQDARQKTEDSLSTIS